MKRISVVVPVYNASKYIGKCIESVLNQSYKNVELILIDDGSLDDSLEIMREYEKKYPKIISVCSQKNQGVGAARNAGMEKATGEFMVFLDSDDWLKEDYLTKLSATIRDNDIVVSGFERYASDYSFQYANVTPCNDWTKFKYCSVAGKMYRTDFIKKNHLKYKKFKIGEDCYFNINAYSKTKKVVVAEYAGYCNYENLSSVTNVKEYNPNNSFIHVLKAIDEEIDVCELNPKDMAFFYIKALVLDIFLHKDYVLKEYLVHEFRENIKWYKIVLDKLNLKFKMRSRKGETFKVNLVVNVFILAYKLQLVGLLMAVVKKMKVNLI